MAKVEGTNLILTYALIMEIFFNELSVEHLSISI